MGVTLLLLEALWLEVTIHHPLARLGKCSLRFTHRAGNLLALCSWQVLMFLPGRGGRYHRATRPRRFAQHLHQWGRPGGGGFCLFWRLIMGISKFPHMSILMWGGTTGGGCNQTMPGEALCGFSRPKFQSPHISTWWRRWGFTLTPAWHWLGSTCH